MAMGLREPAFARYCFHPVPTDVDWSHVRARSPVLHCGHRVARRRVHPELCETELIGRRFGGGEYRAKLLGEWDTERRQEEYLEQVTFCLDDQYWPMTAETRDRIRKQHGV